jgi:hypothetical protein
LVAKWNETAEGSPTWGEDILLKMPEKYFPWMMLALLKQLPIEDSTFNSLRTDGDSCHQGGTLKLPKHLRFSKPTDMTIHWNALEEHFMMVALDF